MEVDTHFAANQSAPKVVYSDDIKETISVAHKLSRKADATVIRDRDYLGALLMTNRLFTRLDALLKAMGTTPGKLEKHLKRATAATPAPAEESQALVRARDIVIAMAGANGGPGTAGNQKLTLETEHLLRALAHANDPVVREVLQAEGITDEAIAAASAKIAAGTPVRQTMFFLREATEVILIVLFFLIVIKEGLGELRLIPSESMVPLLQVGDRVVIEKVTRWWRPYERGDVIVFYPPKTMLKWDPLSVFLRMTGFSGLIYKKEDSIDVAYIKRLIGLPGDRVDVRPGVGVFVNDKQLDEPYVSEIADTCTMVQPTQVCGPITIPQGHYFMMGDNRNHSADSRFWGVVPKERVIGRAVFRVWPPGRFGNFESAPYED